MAEIEKNNIYRSGFAIFVLLAAFTIGEYWIGSVAGAWIAPLFIIALFKAWLIIRDYMHIGRLFSREEEAH